MDIAIVWVIFRSNPEKRAKMNRLAAKLGATKQLIVNNDAHSVESDEFRGSNSAYEFSAYREGLAMLPEGHTGPVLVLNDTVLTNHWGSGWFMLFQQMIRRRSAPSKGMIFSDWRPAVAGVPELERPFFASWVFWCEDADAVTQLKMKLDLLLQQDLPEMSVPYANHIEHWLSGTSRWRGWHQTGDAVSKKRKVFCIRLEHRLSQLLAKEQQIASFSTAFPVYYKLLRWVDRARTLMRRWLLSAKA